MSPQIATAIPPRREGDDHEPDRCSQGAPGSPYGPVQLHRQVTRTQALLRDLGDALVQWYAPPFGVGTVLLDDTDAGSAQESWRGTLRATQALLNRWADLGWVVGPLLERALAPRP